MGGRWSDESLNWMFNCETPAAGKDPQQQPVEEANVAKTKASDDLPIENETTEEDRASKKIKLDGE